MFFYCIILGLCFVILMLLCDIYFPKLLRKIQYRKELKARQKRLEAFTKKMKELEIK